MPGVSPMRQDERAPLLERADEAPPLLKRLFGGAAQHRATQLLRRARTLRGDSSERLKSVLAELEANEGVSRQYILLGLFAILNHFVGGVISMMYLEGWTFHDASYFCVVTLTTVGYGDLSPSTAASKLFVIYYVVVSLCIVSSYVSYFVGLFLDQQEELLLHNVMLRSQPQARSVLARTTALDASDYGGMVFSVGVLGAVLAVGTLIFGRLEGMSVLDALYATIISSATVGFGDLHPTHPSTKYCMTGWLVLSTVAVAKVVADFTEARVKAKQRALTRRVLTAQMDRDSLSMLDSNRDGQVEWGEFLASMLVSCGKVTELEIDTFRLRFDELDRDGDCRIDVDSGL